MDIRSSKELEKSMGDKKFTAKVKWQPNSYIIRNTMCLHYFQEWEQAKRWNEKDED